jgi:hypothetical protein
MKLIRQKENRAVSDDAAVTMSTTVLVQVTLCAPPQQKSPSKSNVYSTYYWKIDTAATANGLLWILGHCENTTPREKGLHVYMLK